MIYTVTMNPAIDCAMTAEKLTLGRVNRASSQNIRFGGKGINVSYVLREFGSSSVLTGFTAGFTGDALESGLTAEGFFCDFIRLAEGNTRINVKLTASGTDGDPDTELNAPGAVPSDAELGLLTQKLSSLTAGDAVVLAGSLPPGVSPDYVTEIADTLPEGVSLICDLSGRFLRLALSCSPDLVKPNVHELFEIFGITATPDNLKSRTIIKECAERLISMGAKNALITMGEGGAYYISSGGDAGFIPSPEIPGSANEARSAVGCGDSAVAGWLMGMGYAGKDVRITALSAAGIDPAACKAETAARLAVILGSTSYYFGFPASPDRVHILADS